MSLKQINRVDLHPVNFTDAWQAQINLSWNGRPSRKAVSKMLQKELADIERSLDKDFAFRHDTGMDTTYIFFRNKTDAVSWYLMVS